VIENGGAAGMGAGRATGLDAGEVGITACAGAESDLATQVEIEIAVTIVVEKRGVGMEPGTELHAAYSSLVCDIRESTVAVILIKDVLAVLSDEEIGETVVIIVAPDAAEAVAGTGDTCFFRDISERAIAVVAVKRVADADATVVAIAPVDEVDVLPAVAVKIRNANAGTELFEIDGDAIAALEVGEADARFSRDVSEMDGLGW